MATQSIIQVESLPATTRLYAEQMTNLQLCFLERDFVSTLRHRTLLNLIHGMTSKTCTWLSQYRTG